MVRIRTISLIATLGIVACAGTASTFLLDRTPAEPLVEMVGSPNVTTLDEQVAVFDGRRSVHKQRVEFAIANTGRADLLLEAGHTSCDCAGLRVRDNLVKPGAQTLVWLDVVPPQVGEKIIHAQLRTNIQNLPTLTLHHRLIGDGKPPYLLNGERFINLPPNLSVGDRVPLTFTSIEARESMPWLADGSCSFDFVHVLAPVIEDRPANDGDLVTRRYIFNLEITAASPNGLVDGVFVLQTREESVPVYQVFVRGNNAANFQMVPSSLWVKLDSDSKFVRRTILLRCREPGQMPEDDFEPLAISWLSVARVDREGAGIQGFCITINAERVPAGTTATQLVFRSSDSPEEQATVSLVVTNNRQAISTGDLTLEDSARSGSP